MRARRRTWPHYVRLREALRSYEREALAVLDRAREKWGGVSEGKRRHLRGFSVPLLAFVLGTAATREYPEGEYEDA